MLQKFTNLTISIVLLLVLNGCQKSAEDHYNKGMELVNSQNYFPAIEEFDKAIKADPKFAKAYLERGRYVLNSDTQKGIADLTKAMELDSTLKKDALIARGRGYFNYSGYIQALEDFENVLLMEPNNKQILSLAAGCKVLLKEFSGAKKYLDLRIKYYPNDAEGYYSRGLYRVTAFDDEIGGCEDLSKAKLLFNPNEKYLGKNLKSEIERLIYKHCRKKK